MAQKPQSIIILNGKSSQNDELRQAVTVLREEGYPLHVRVTWEHGDALRYVREAIAMEADNVIAAGGDGTINEIAVALAHQEAEHRPCLGIVPLGTANDLATSCRIPTDLHQALRLAILGRATAIDLARVNDRHYFINMATGGFATRITTETPAAMKSALGGAAYVLNALLRIDTLKAERCQVKGPDFDWEGDTLVIAIGNGRQAGGGQQLCPDAVLNDGLLQLRVLSAKELLPNMMQALMSGGENPNMITTALPWLDISAPNEMTFNLDGEPLTDKHFRIEVVPAALRCRFPSPCPLLSE
ncbi:lipid kinase YegS [Lonsdalea quercina]|uniref:lipid kinase YegS n=1 Tax=Lonsdalea quercina TaxID=71657 RepID=UPI0039765416